MSKRPFHSCRIFSLRASSRPRRDADDWKATVPRPPPVRVDDEEMRHDVRSEDMRRVHPDLPASPHGRLRHVAQCDAVAYERECARLRRLSHETESTVSSAASSVVPPSPPTPFAIV
jgi:hypothetical protein